MIYDMDYDQNNPIWKLVRILGATTLLADREHYVADSLQHLFGLSSLALIGPSGDAWQIKDPRFQDTKEDFQKQNLYDFLLNGTELSRGYAHLGDDWTGSFLRIAYIPRPPLLRADGAFPGEFVQLYLKVGKDETAGGISRSLIIQRALVMRSSCGLTPVTISRIVWACVARMRFSAARCWPALIWCMGI